MVIAGFLLVGGATVTFAADDTGQKAAPQEPPAKTSKGWPILKPGMTAKEVIRAIGKPERIKPRESKEGKAEVWTYRRELGRWTDQRVVAEMGLPAFISTGPGNGGMGTVYEPVYRTEHVTEIQVSSILMFDDKLVTATQQTELERRID